MYLGGLAPGISAAGPTAASAAGALCPRSEVCWGGVVVDDFLGLTARNQCFLLGGVISKYGLDIRIKYVFLF
jgi:hypothetical protein